VSPRQWQRTGKDMPTLRTHNLLFDHETSAIRIESPYTHGALLIELKQPGSLFVRIPPWVDRREIDIAGNDSALWTNGYLSFSKIGAGKRIRLHFPLKRTETVLAGGLHIHPIRVKMEGDATIAMDNFSADLIFFDPYA